MKNKLIKGFTLAELMIVVVIIGLFAAMAIPAFQKVRETAVVRKVEKGMKLTDDERVIYKEYLQENKDKVKKERVEIEKSEGMKIEGYIVIKDKNDIKEVRIDGETIYLVPIK